MILRLSVCLLVFCLSHLPPHPRLDHDAEAVKKWTEGFGTVLLNTADCPDCFLMVYSSYLESLTSVDKVFDSRSEYVIFVDWTVAVDLGCWN